MNEITRIHLARVAYDIELGGKKQFDTYLKDIKATLHNDETLMEVEQRMSEILLERGVKAGGVITESDVQAIRAQLGEPRDFGDTQEEEDVVDQPVRRRLLRDMEHKQISGVAAGVAAYFGTEVVVVRLVFIVLALMNGLGLLLYLVLWAIMPPARSLSDRLSLRGQTATLESYKAYDGTASTNGTPAWMLALGRLVLGVGLLLIGWAPVIIGTMGTVVTFTHQRENVFPAGAFDWTVIAAAWVGALAFSVFMTTLGLAVLRWNFTRIKWPLIISGVVGLLAALTIAAVGPLAADELKERTCTPIYSHAHFRDEVCQPYNLNTESL